MEERISSIIKSPLKIRELLGQCVGIDASSSLLGQAFCSNYCTSPLQNLEAFYNKLINRTIRHRYISTVGEEAASGQIRLSVGLFVALECLFLEPRAVSTHPIPMHDIIIRMT